MMEELTKVQYEEGDTKIVREVLHNLEPFTALVRARRQQKVQPGYPPSFPFQHRGGKGAV